MRGERECLTLSPCYLVIDGSSTHHLRVRENKHGKERQQQSEIGGEFTLGPQFCPINRLPVCCVFCMTKEGNIKLPFVMKMHFAN